ncbi:MAG: right-handed parallel beta-helix repeat-containing protein [Phycisphaerae bacterium]|nr:right-handed parallel beta-helix repeat-containing protein [Tepidisphaeraceae bacterium]
MSAPAWLPKAPPLPRPTGPVIRVATVDELFRAADAVKPGGTILVADGHYAMPRYFELRTDRVTLRGESGRRDKVVLDGGTNRHGELLGITGCSGVTIADLTVQNARTNAIKINSDRFTTAVTVYNCVIRNAWQRGVKGPAVRPADRDKFRPTDCRIQHCLFYNDRPKRYADDPDDNAGNFGGNYVGGIDAMYARRWTISDNVFRGIKGRTGEGRGAVFLWQFAEECVVERNVIVDCDSGICLGNGHKPADVAAHCTGCVVRNNVLARCPEQGILAHHTKDCRIVHNTVHDPTARFKRLIRIVGGAEGLTVVNNLLSGPPIRVETTDKITSRGNVEREMAGAFVDVAAGDLHLRAAAPGVTDAGESVADAPADFDGRRRDARPDIGAHEWANKP